MYDNPPPAGIRVITRFSPFAFLLYLARTRLHLDGGLAVERPWGETAIPVQPGRHQVRCYCRWLFWRAFGDAAIVVDVPPGQLVNLVWQPPWLPFQPGRWSVLGVQPLTTPVPEPAAVAQPALSAEPAPSAQPEVQAEVETLTQSPESPQAQVAQVVQADEAAAASPEEVALPEPQPEVEVSEPSEAHLHAVTTQMQSPLPVAGWYPDPARRHQYRYWDGKEWAPHVADNGVMAADPL